MVKQNAEIKEREIKPINGFLMLLMMVVLFISSICLFVVSGMLSEGKETLSTEGGIALGVGFLLMFTSIIGSIGFKIVNPNEAAVLVLFGKYYGTLKSDGFWWINPFCITLNTANSNGLGAKRGKLSLKAMTLNNEKQKVNDEDGNPIEIGVIVIWRIVDTAKAIFSVDNYLTYISTQADAAIRQVARLYPYDISEVGEEKSLRGSSQEIAEELRKELQSRVNISGLEIVEARIAHLAYAQEIAAAMLQRQQAKAIIEARQKIVEGAVGMVEMALNKLSEKQIVTLDDEKKATMVSNLLVVLCGNRDAQPIVNTGSIY